LKLRQFIPVLIIAAGIGAYHNSLQGPFIFDDVSCILDNPHIRHLWPIWDAMSTHTESAVNGRPVVCLTLAVNYALGGLNVWGYHAFNLTVHLLAALVLFGILRRTFEGEKLRDRFGAAAVWLAAAIALIWEVHPLQTECVDYIVQRTESLMGLFLLLTLYCTLRGSQSSRPRVWYLAAVVSCALGMGSKEVMVGAPLIVLLYDRMFLASSFRKLWQRRISLYIGLAATWLMLGGLVAGVPHSTTGFGVKGLTSWDYLKTEAGVIVYYLRLCFWPHPLVINYSDWPITLSLEDALVSGAAVLGLLGATVWAFRCRPWLGFLGAWFFIILGPTSSILPSAGEAVAERRMYLPLAAVVTIVLVGTFALEKRFVNKQQGIALGCVAGGSVAVLLTSLTIQRNGDYNSEVTIWQDTVEKRPNNPQARCQLGSALLRAGDAQKAVEEFVQALRIKPDDAAAQNNLGNALLQAGNAQEAIEHYEQALRIQPDFAEAHNNLAIALVQLGRLSEAISHNEQALRINPNNTEAHNNLGVVLMGQGRLPEAIGHYQQALRIEPNYADAHNNLGLALARAGHAPEAIEHYEQALRAKPDYAQAHNNLGLALAGLGRLQEAIDHYQQALRLKPNYADAHNNLGFALARAGHTPEAIEHYTQALWLQPDFADAYNNLAWLLATHAPAEGGDVVRAVSLAQRACELTGSRRAGYLDTLAAAYAAAGRFSEAVTTAQKAIDLARAAGPPKLIAEFEARLELYRSGHAYLQSVGDDESRQPLMNPSNR
jgi:Flp pilus assembly protein TadD